MSAALFTGVATHANLPVPARQLPQRKQSATHTSSWPAATKQMLSAALPTERSEWTILPPSRLSPVSFLNVPSLFDSAGSRRDEPYSTATLMSADEPVWELTEPRPARGGSGSRRAAWCSRSRMRRGPRRRCTAVRLWVGWTGRTHEEVEEGVVDDAEDRDAADSEADGGCDHGEAVDLR